MFVMQSTHQRALDRIAALEQQLQQSTQECSKLKEELTKLTTKAEHASVRFDFDADFQKATPVVAFNDDSVEKLLEIRRISPNATDSFSVQLALLTLAEEVAGQIVDLYAVDPVEV